MPYSPIDPKSIQDALTDLAAREPRARPKSKVDSLEPYRDEIIAQRARGYTWPDIADALRTRGIKITHMTLRKVMTRRKRSPATATAPSASQSPVQPTAPPTKPTTQPAPQASRP